MNETRNRTLDILRGIAILCVVVGHCYFFERDSKTLIVIYSFHMPLFVLTSGYLYRGKKFSHAFLAGKVQSILLPYFTVAFFSMFTALPTEERSFSTALVDIFVGNALDGRLAYNTALWFLPMLFLCVSFFALLYTLADRSKHRELLLTVGALALTVYGYYLMCIKRERLVWNLEIALFMQGFMLAGYLFRRAEARWAETCSTLLRSVLIVAAFALWVLGVYINRRVDLNGRNVGNVWVYAMTALAATFFLYEVSKHILLRIRPIAWALSWCGENSLYIMVLHLPISHVIYGGLHQYLPALWKNMVWEQNWSGVFYILFYDLLMIALVKQLLPFHRSKKTTDGKEKTAAGVLPIEKDQP